MELRVDWDRVRGALGGFSVFASELGCIGGVASAVGTLCWLKIWLKGRGRRGPATTVRARERREDGWGSSSLGGGGGGSSLSVLAAEDAGGGLPDMRSGVFSNMFSNSLCCRRRPMILSTYSVRALFSAFKDLASVSSRL